MADNQNNQQLKRSPFFRVSLQWVMVVPFVVQTIFIVGVVGYLSYQSGRQSLENIANQLSRQTSERVSDHLNRYLQISQQAARDNSWLVEQGMLNLNNQEQLRQQLWRQMQLNPSIPANGFWGDDGNGIGYVRISSKEMQRLAPKAAVRSIPLGTVFYNEVSSNSRRYYAIDAQGKRTKLLHQLLNDDFRSTDWYRYAKTTMKQSWTPVNLARVIPVLQTCAFAPVYDGDGKFYGFFGANYLLSQISDFLNGLHFSPNGKVFILERSGDLVATSVMTEELSIKQGDGKFTRVSASNSQDINTREVSKQLIQKFGNFDKLTESKQLSLTIAGQRQFVQVTPYNDHYGLDWHLIIVIPEADFMKEIQENVGRTAMLSGLALLVSIGIGIWTSRRIVRSLSHLTQATKSFAESRLEQAIPDTHIAEVNILAEGFQQMVTEIQSADQMRLNYEQDLEQQVAEKTADLVEAQRIARVGSWDLDVATGAIKWSPELFRILGFESSIELPTYPNIFDHVLPEDRSKLHKAIDDAIAYGTAYSIEHVNSRPDGSICYLLSHGEPIFDEQGKVVKIHGTTQDISEQQAALRELRQAEIALKQSETRFLEISESSPDIIYIYVRRVDGSFYFEHVSRAVESVSELSVEQVLESDDAIPSDIYHSDVAVYRAALQISLETLQPFFHEWRIITPSGKLKWLKTKSVPKQRDNGEIAWYGVTRDISDRKQSEIALMQTEAQLRAANLELQRLVNLDGLTQIANRRCFDEHLSIEWLRASREEQPFSLLIFDVDYFKRYNDCYGHQLGDDCLIKVAQAVDYLMRRETDLVARYGGEEFVVMLPNTNLEGAIAVSERIQAKIAELKIPHQHSDVNDFVSLSIGIASDIPNLKQSPYDLINQADQALYYAKKHGRNQSAIFGENNLI